MNILYFIPARGGSKGLPGKNILLLGNKPMIAHSIIAAQNSSYKGTVLVSTDDIKIADVAKQYSAEVPFMRPAELANDTAATIDVIFHALEFYKTKGQTFDIVVLLQPTSPLRITEDIENAIKIMFEKKAEAVVSVCPADHHPLWANTLPESGSMKQFLRDEVKGKNRQQLPVYYRLNGAVFVSSVAALYKHKTFIHENTYSYVMPENRSIDIDNFLDFKMAELLIKI